MIYKGVKMDLSLIYTSIVILVFIIIISLYMNKTTELVKPVPKCYICGKIGHWECGKPTEVIPKLMYTTT